ncbi:hypothetical protein AB0D11_32995 [Streptomyces monashensis]|uniref:hypothetical protein n=1 Tax=Streptomyces monashensis TaxID=1678012 RepID=UPI003405E93B
MTSAQRPLPARESRPPMGWNSWDCYGPTVTEDEVLANAVFLRDRLLPHGWDTVVVDIQWYEPTARAHGYNPDAPLVLDAYGRQLPAPNRFPSAAGGAGFAPLARRVHELGLRFGLHIMRGIPRRAVTARLPVLGTEFTADQIADTGSVCPGTPTITAWTTTVRAPRPTTTPRWPSSPTGVWTSSRPTTCSSRTTSGRSRPTRGRSTAAAGASS